MKGWDNMKSIENIIENVLDSNFFNLTDRELSVLINCHAKETLNNLEKPTNELKEIVDIIKQSANETLKIHDVEYSKQEVINILTKYLKEQQEV